MFLTNKGSRTNRSRRPGLWGLLPGLAAAFLVVAAGGIYSTSGLLSLDSGELSTLLPDSREYLHSLAFSLGIAGISTGISLFLAVPLAVWIWRQNNFTLRDLYTIPLILPHIVAAFFVIAFFSQSGMISSLVQKLGLIQRPSDFPVLVFDASGRGIILAYVYKETSFVTLMILASLKKLPPGLMENARMFRSPPLQRFRSIILPHIGGSLWYSGIIIFLYSFGAYDIPYLLGSSSNPMLSIEAYRLFFTGSLSQRPAAILLLSFAWLISLVFLGLFIVSRVVFSPRQEEQSWQE
ncbi:ABC transporter permease [Salinispira pacifica]|uniref:ABC transporter permease n=1 Tax=Salinispira pacifica TaxID=1307761 RepID=UPI0006A6BFDA|nr:ABC transporter permease subunit [Salinispira pacifica]